MGIKLFENVHKANEAFHDHKAVIDGEEYEVNPGDKVVINGDEYEVTHLGLRSNRAIPQGIAQIPDRKWKHSNGHKGSHGTGTPFVTSVDPQ